MAAGKGLAGAHNEPDDSIEGCWPRALWMQRWRARA